MYIQDQLTADRVNDENLSFYRAIGVDYLTIYPPPALAGESAMVEYLGHMADLAGRHGLRLHNLAAAGPDEVTLGLPGRDAVIERWCGLIRAMGRVGVPLLGYNFKPVGNFRTTPSEGRGGALYSTFDHDEWAAEAAGAPDDATRSIGEEALRANLTHFLERLLPVAEEAGVTLALHPDDPPIPEPMGGAARIVSTLDQYQRIFDAVPSPRSAMLFCQGCVAEMGEDVPAAIRRMGRQGRVAYVHFRNIRGTPRSFREVFVDEGQVDMLEAMRTYLEVGFDGPFMMDHTPRIPGDRDGREGHAFAVGYIRALIQAVYGPAGRRATK